jgi:hypothetical protein
MRAAIGASVSPKLSERFKMPAVFGRRESVSEDVQIAVIGSKFEVGIVRAVPLIEHLFDAVVAITKAEADRSFVSLLAGVAFDVQVHPSQFCLIDGVCAFAVARMLAVFRP